MHPLKVDQPYPYEQWWVAAYSSEVGRELLGRTILGDRVILYRTEAGEAVALSGICPHRSYPLAKGKLVGDAVQCGYHGFTFDSGGNCVFVPNQTGVPSNSSLRQYPVVERGGLLWIWTGEVGNAAPDLVPPVERLGLSPDWKSDYSPPITTVGRYTLLIDNLLDLGHASFIHADTIPGGEAVAMIPVTVIENEESLNVERIGRNLPINPFIKLQFPDNDGPVDQHFDAEYYAPSIIRTGGTTFRSGLTEPLGTQNFIHCITPETPTSTHYFVITTRNFGHDNDVLSQVNVDMGSRIQPQDEEAMAAVEEVLQSATGPIREVSARVDTGALKVRHRLESQIRAECKAKDVPVADVAVGLDG
ncbi:aromatic ring-hydroxylating dioxygenase subunit alpha [Sphingobium bisphenolivorans]|uniref:aromatic ring-hydroxylating dioxygenase subunit alpha n=1 Tax=Sphingobium bisphenolivorans TaxID=1335760 RepID=UPI00039BE990|nr:aromatic ring-hydroxylating dioxygenase subunit alpha [Sphingobium bisphenolivorans]